MPHPAQHLVPVQAAVHTIVGRVGHPLDKQPHTPLTVRVITVQHPLQQALLLDHRPSLHSRCVCCDVLHRGIYPFFAGDTDMINAVESLVGNHCT